MTTFHFIRHGYVEDPNKVFYGRLPGFPLSADGRDCIRYTAKQLERFKITHIYTSPLLRTQQSAEILSDLLKSPVTVDDRILEIATAYEGRTLADLIEHPPKTRDYLESKQEIFDRMASFLNDAAGTHPDQQVVAVSHGAPIRILEMGLQHQAMTNWVYEQEEVPACGSDTIITVDGDTYQVKRASL